MVALTGEIVSELNVAECTVSDAGVVFVTPPNVAVIVVVPALKPVAKPALVIFAIA